MISNINCSGSLLGVGQLLNGAYESLLILTLCSLLWTGQAKLGWNYYMLTELQWHINSYIFIFDNQMEIFY